MDTPAEALEGHVDTDGEGQLGAEAQSLFGRACSSRLRIDGDHDLGSARCEASSPREVVGVASTDRGRVGHEQVVPTERVQSFGLGHAKAHQPSNLGRAALQDPAEQIRRAHALGRDPQGQPVCTGEAPDPLDVSIKSGEIEHRDRRRLPLDCAREMRPRHRARAYTGSPSCAGARRLDRDRFLD